MNFMKYPTKNDISISNAVLKLAKLDCYVDEDTHELTVVEADYAHDLSDVPPELLFALHQSGCCLSALEDALMEDDVIYDK